MCGSQHCQVLPGGRVGTWQLGRSWWCCHVSSTAFTVQQQWHSCKAKLVSLLWYEAIWFLILELGSGEDGWGLSRYLLTRSITCYPPGHRTSPPPAGPRTRSACASSLGTRGCGCWCRAGGRTCTRQSPRSSWTLQNGNCIILPRLLHCRVGWYGRPTTDVEISLLGISVALEIYNCDIDWIG